MPEVARGRRLAREYARGFVCPECGSGPSVACVGSRGQAREQNHAERVAVARASLGKRSADRVSVVVAGVGPDRPGPGGWAALMTVGARELQLGGHADLATESRMTLTALVEAFRALPSKPLKLTVEVDSADTVHALRNGWPARWLERGWVKQDGTPVKNRDLWESLAVEIEAHDVTWQSVTNDADRRERVRGAAAAHRQAA
jgi:ribonuclease HI